MKFTGERVTAKNQALYPEHLARYQFAAKPLGGGRVLDVACGLGFGSRLLAKTAGEVYGVDHDQVSIVLAKASWSQQSNLKFYLSDAAKTPFANNFFDGVVSLETIEHLPDYDRFLQEVNRVLKPKGTFILSTPDRKVTQEILLDTSYRNPFHLHEFSRSELEEILSRYFVISGVYGQFFYQPSFWRLAIRNVGRLWFRFDQKKLIKRVLPLGMVLGLPRRLAGMGRDNQVYPLQPGKSAQSLVVVCHSAEKSG